MSGVALDYFLSVPDLDDFGFVTGHHWAAEPGYSGMIDLASHAQIVEAAARPDQPRGLFVAAYTGDAPKGLADRGGVILAGEDARDARPDAATRRIIGDLLGFVPLGDTLAEWIWSLLTDGADPANLDACGLYVPRHDLAMPLWLGGKEPIRQERFEWGQNAAYTAKLLDVLQRKWGAIRELALDGKTTDPDLHLRAADFDAEKFAGRKPELKADWFAEAKPAEWEAAEDLKPHATSIAESFNKADSSTLGPDLSWTETVNDLEVFSNTCRPVGTTNANFRARADSDLAGTDHYGQCDAVLMSTQTARYLGPAARFATAADTCYLASLFGNASVPNGTSVLQPQKVVTATVTPLGVGTNQSVTVPDTLKIECNGSTITTYFNGAAAEAITDTSITTGTRCGVGLRGTNVWEVDNFSAADLATGNRRRRVICGEAA